MEVDSDRDDRVFAHLRKEIVDRLDTIQRMNEELSNLRSDVISGRWWRMHRSLSAADIDSLLVSGRTDFIRDKLVALIDSRKAKR